MPTADDRDATIEAAPVETATEPAEPTTPTFSLGDVTKLVQESVRSAVSEAVAVTRPVSQAPPPEPEPAGATVEEFQENPLSAIEKTVQRALHPVRQEMKQFRSFGLNKLADLTGKTVLEKLPFYKDFKNEVDAKLSTLDPALRADATTLQLVYDSVVSSHIAEIQARARDEGLRQARTDAPVPGTAGNSRTKGGTPSVPTPEELGLTEEQIAEIEARGGPDRFAYAVSQGRTPNWKTWVEKRQALATTPKLRGRAVMPFTKLEPRKNKIVGGQ